MHNFLKSSRDKKIREEIFSHGPKPEQLTLAMSQEFLLKETREKIDNIACFFFRFFFLLIFIENNELFLASNCSNAEFAV